MVAPHVTLFNGQATFVLVAKQQAYVSDYLAAKGADGVKFTPVVKVAETGLAFSVRATIAADGTHVGIAATIYQKTLLCMDEVPYQQAPPERKLKIQHPNVDAIEVPMAVSLAQGETELVSMPEAGNEPDTLRFALIKATIPDPNPPLH